MPQEPTKSRPHPFPWRGVFLRAAAGMVLLVLVVRLAWGWYAGRLVAAQLEPIRQRGEPTTLAEMPWEDVPDAGNAWLIQQKAIDSVSTTVESPANSTLEYYDYPPFPKAWTQRAVASESANAPAMALARQARALTAVQIGQRPAEPSQVQFGYLTGSRKLANTLGDGAVFRHVNGDDAEAVERLIDILHLARSLRHVDFIVPQLVAVGIEAIAAHDVLVIAPEIRVTSGAARPTDRPALREQVRGLIAALLDEDLAWDRLPRSLMAERLMLANSIRRNADGTWMIRPLSDMEAVRLRRNIGITIAASRLRTKPAVEAALAECKWDRYDPFTSDSPPRHSRYFGVGGEGFGRYLETHSRVIAYRRIAAVALAIRLYQADHDGRRPERLEQLVPDYLTQLPADPYSATGQPFAYLILPGARPDGADRPMLAFTPTGAVGVGPGPAPEYSWTSWKRPRGNAEIRQYRDLSRFVPPPEPSPQAVEGDPAEPDAPGEQPEQQQGAEQP